MTTRQSTASAPVAVYGVNGRVCRGEADFEWNIEDPAAVRMTFRVPGDPAVEWLIARWMLMAGIGSETFVGEGDALVRRSGTRATTLRFLTDEGTADVVISTGLLLQFLDRCEKACPSGSPAEDERLSAWTGALLISMRVPCAAVAMPDEEAAVERARQILDGAT